MNEGAVTADIQIAQAAIPLIEELVPFLVNLFKKHAPAASETDVTQAVTTVAQAAASVHSGLTGEAEVRGTAVAGAVANAIANPPEPVAPNGGVHFQGSVPIPTK